MANKTTMRFPIGIQSFDVLRENGYTYVDKTDMIFQLAQQHICFLCRPRRFGKSLTISTLEAYFRGKSHLFKGLKIDSLEHQWVEYPVFRIDFNGENYLDKDVLAAKLDDCICKWEEEWGATMPQDSSLGSRFANVLEQAHLQSGLRCVVLIDEYDKPLLDVLSEPMEEDNRNILKGFYSVFKLADQHLRFVLLTGVTKFSQVSVFSGFNQPNDISLNPKYEAICGITEDELHAYFKDCLQTLSEEYSASFDDISLRMKRFYDGYHFSRKMTDIYNPFSVFNAFDNSEIRPYWYSTGTPAYLVKLLEKRKVNVVEMLAQSYTTDYFIDYRADVEEPLAMLYQSGYLTIKDVDLNRGLYRLDFPNNEVKIGFVSLLANTYFNGKDELPLIESLLNALGDGRIEEFISRLTAFFSSIGYEMRKDKEYHFQYTLFLLFRLMSCYSVVIEKHNSQGRADMIVETANHVYIFEFKLDGTAQEALQQIEDKGYALPYADDPRPLHKVGISFGKQSGTIDSWLVA